MGNIRVHELAKELGVQSKDVTGIIKTAYGKDVTAMSALEDAEVQAVKNHLNRSAASSAEPSAAQGPAQQDESVSAKTRPAVQADAAGKDASSGKAPEAQHPVRKKKNISVVFNRSGDDRRRSSQRPGGGPQNRRPAQGQEGQRSRKVSRRLQESEREQREKQNELERAAAQEAARKAAAEQEEARRKAAQQAEKERLEQEQARKAAQVSSAAAEVPTQEIPAPVPEQTLRKEVPQTAEPAAEQNVPQTVQNTEKKPVVRKNIMADLQRQEEERKKAAQARKQQQKARSERAKDAGKSQEARSDGRGGQSTRSGGRSERANKDNNRTSGDRNRSGSAARPSQQRQGAAQGSKSAVFNENNGGAAKTGARKGKDAGKKQQGDHRSDKRRGSRLDKSEKSFSLEKQSSHKKPHKNPQQFNEAGEEIRTITVPDSLTLKELADLIKIAPNALIKKLFLAGKIMTVNQELTFEEAEEIALEYNCIAEREETVDLIEELLREEEENEEDLVTRPPVVCVMGHVDHGKTSLLDAIRHTHHIDTEAGGITQAIGAYVVDVGDRKITFLDTPGHEAFTAMRMRGANSTDIAVLVVAADDGVMPQTVEAINHAKAAGIDLIVAINKIDKPGANIDRVKQELSEYQLIPEDWGGSTVFCNISAKTGEGIDELLEMILLSADVLELKANPNRAARGLVIESRLDKGKGVVATVLVQKGTLKVGQPVAAGESYGRVRAMTDEDGHPVKSAGPSVPVEIQGLSTVPNAGEIFVALESEKQARAFAETFISEGRNKLLADTKSRMSLDDLYEQIQAGSVKELNIIIKADVQGSAEAIKQSLQKLSNDEVVVKIIHDGVGAINESDVVLAATSNALIIGFNVSPDAAAKSTAESEDVEIKLYSVIYNAIDDVERAMKGMLDPVYEEQITGHAQIRQIYKASGVGNIAGSYVLDGVVRRDSKIRLLRGEELIHEGELSSLKRFKDDVKEVKAGFECGIVIGGFDQIAVDDVIEAYTMVEMPRT